MCWAIGEDWGRPIHQYERDEVLGIISLATVSTITIVAIIIISNNGIMIREEHSMVILLKYRRMCWEFGASPLSSPSSLPSSSSEVTTTSSTVACSCHPPQTDKVL